MEQRYDHTLYDAEIRAKWEKNSLYKKAVDGYTPFTIDTPPPTVSGSLHIGHIFSYTHTDIIARYKRMTGHNVVYPFGFDCNGLATERFVEKKHNTHVSKIGREAFIDLCLSTTEEMKIQFVDLWKTIGLSADFENTYSTISPEVQRIAQESFVRLFHKGFCYIKEEPALFCTRCRTTVAQAELDDMLSDSTFNTIPFYLEGGEQVLIATTRPELLPSCVALLYHPADARYMHLAGKKARTPLFDREVPVLSDETVLIEKGTGLVMVCTFGDKTDIEWFKKHNLPYVQSIGLDGKYAARVPELAGLSVVEARKKVLELLKERNLLIEQKNISHSVHVHERCKHPIEYMILPQWFVHVVKHKETLLRLADKVKWHPEYMKARYVDWVKNLSWDWCIARQRVYGIPFPVWYCNDCHGVIVASLEELPLDPQQHSYRVCTHCHSTNTRPEKDVMDTWNTSSLTPYIVKQLVTGKDISPFENHTFLPMNMRPQAHDIIRTWAFYTLVKAWMHDDQIPWHGIVISGYVLSEKNEKISKSKNNAPTEPSVLLTQYAPDAIRFWAASGSLGQDTAFSAEQIKIGQKLMNKLWNASKFIYMNRGSYIHTDAQPKSMNIVHRWMVQRVDEAVHRYHNSFASYDFSSALQHVEGVFWADFCDNYIEIVKDQFFKPELYSEEEIFATQWTLHYSAYRILQMYAPFLPYCTDYIYTILYARYDKHVSIHETVIKKVELSLDVSVERQMQMVLSVISAVRKMKSEHQLSLKTELESLSLVVDVHYHAIIQQVAALLLGVCKAKKIECIEQGIATLDNQGGMYVMTIVI